MLRRIGSNGGSTKLPVLAVAAAIAALLVGWAPAFGADTILFDPDGSVPFGGLPGDTESHPVTINAGGNAPRPIGSLDWQVGNALSIGGGNPNQVGNILPLVYQARLAATVPPSTITGLNTTFEVTIIARFVEQVISISGTTIQLKLVADPSNIIQVFYDTVPTDFSNDLAGTGFDDGLLILTATPQVNPTSIFDSDFSLSSTTTQQYDQFGANDYPGVTTLVGSGTTAIDSVVNYARSDFFSSLVAGGSIVATHFDTDQRTPFTQVDPSRLFFAPGATGDGFQPTVTPNIGTVNGNGADFQFQADASQSFTVAAVPEPGTICGALMGLGFACVGAARKVRRSRTKAVPV